MSTYPMTNFGDDPFDQDEYDVGCECEMDWSCGLHSFQAPWIDRRWQGQDDEEACMFAEALILGSVDWQ